ncbi:hypothetical protein BD408DRAFT_455940, partial [Parasitella parasitica]
SLTISKKIISNMPEFQHPTDMNQVTVIMQQLQQQLASLSERVNQHDGILARLDALEKENQTLKKILQDKDLVIEKLQATSQEYAKHTPTKGGSGSTTTATATTDPATISYTAIAKKASHRPDPTKAAKRKLAAGRLFKTSATKGPQGYQYVYIGRSGKILRSEIRRTLKQLGVDTSRILDINFPASEAIGILLHTQYVNEFLSLLRESGSEILADFDPLNPANIADPKYADYTEHDRMELTAEMVNTRCVDALSHIRPLNVSSVGRWFLELGWIGQAELDEAVADAMDRLKKKDPTKAAFLFKPLMSLINESCSGNVSNVSVPPVFVSLSLWNANGLRQTTVHDVISHILDTHVLFVTETWLISGSYPIDWSQYHLYGSKVPGAFNRGSGGISAFVSPSCPFMVSQLPSYNPHTLSLKVGTLTVHCVYLPPPLSSDRVLSTLNSLPLTRDTVLCGDFNARLGPLTGDSISNAR